MSAPALRGRDAAPRVRTGRGLLIAGSIMLGLVVLAGLIGPLLTPWGPTEIDDGAVRRPPGGAHLLGTDLNGMDVLTRTLAAVRIDLGIAVISVAVAVVLGALIGALSGYAGGWFDAVVMRVLEIVQAFPTFILALAIAALVGPGSVNMAIVIAAVSTPAYARLVRSEVMVVRELPYLDAARTSGLSARRVLWRHVLPNSLTPVRTVAPLNIGWAVLILAGLSFLGLGVPVPQAEWGAMISQGTTDVIAGRLWTTLPPGIALVLCVLGCALIGEGLQERATAKAAR
ncbi:ABC transporter permease [Nakamurella flava]|nr:ABC transporter permease [Nakamurella flava]